MAIVLEANYAKKLGLPGYSSHQYSVSIRTELTDLNNVAEESSRLYRLLQDAVDHSIKEVGFMPDPHTYGNAENGTASNGANGRNGHQATNGDTAWKCSDKQRDLIEKLVAEKGLDKHEIEALAQERFGVGVKQLDRLQASGLIDEMFERYGDAVPQQRGRHANGRVAQRPRAAARSRVGGGAA